MSIESLAIALHHSRATGSAKLVLLGIANHDGDGGSWPSVDTLSIYAGTNDRNVQRAIQRLERLGEVEVWQQQGGTATTPDYARTNLYKFILCCPPNCDRTKNHRLICSACARPLRPAERFDGIHKKCAANRVAETTPGVASDAPVVSPVTPEPASNPSTGKSLSSSSSNRAREAWPYVEHLRHNSPTLCPELPDPLNPKYCQMGHVLSAPLNRDGFPAEYVARMNAWLQHEAVSA